MLQFHARTSCNVLQYQVKQIRSLSLRFKHRDITVILLCSAYAAALVHVSTYGKFTGESKIKFERSSQGG
jgi:hypothetical protein